VVRVWLVEGVRVSLVEGVRRLVCRVVLMFIIQFSMLILARTLHRLELLIATQLPLSYEVTNGNDLGHSRLNEPIQS